MVDDGSSRNGRPKVSGVFWDQLEFSEWDLIKEQVDRRFGVSQLKSGQRSCDSCPNNPANNPYASGFCNCTLGTMETRC